MPNENEYIAKVDRILDRVFDNLDAEDLTPDRATKLLAVAERLFKLKRALGASPEDDADVERQFRNFEN